MPELRTPLCDLLGIEYPVMQAGMGMGGGELLTTPELVAAVSEAGGFGCLGATGLAPAEIRDTVRQIRALTDRPFGVDLLLPSPSGLSTAQGTREDVRVDIKANFAEHWRIVQSLYERYGLEYSPSPRPLTVTPEHVRLQADAVFDEGVPVLVAGLGLPEWLLPDAHEAGTLVGGLVGNVKGAARQISAGVDFVIAQGAEAGGHVGRVATLTLVPQVVDVAGSTPVVAAGGIGDGRGLAAALALGGQGVWCGTAFLFSDEAHLHHIHRRQLESATSDQLVVSGIYTGKPSRTFRNEIYDLWTQTGLEPLPMPHQKVMMEDFVNSAIQAGRYDLVNNPAGQVAGMLSGSRPAREIVLSMVEECVNVTGRLASYVS